MTAIGDAIMREARKNLGLWEWAGDDHNPKIIQMYADAGHSEIRKDEVPWCAAFVGSVLARVGLRNTGSLLAKSYLDWGQPVSLNEAEPGDIVIFDRGTKSWQGHVAFFVARENGGIRCLGGNQNNQVNETRYSASKLAGIRRAKPQRLSPAQSTTVNATGVGTAGAVATGVTAVGSLDGTAQIIAVVGLLVVLIAFGVIFRERIKKWAQGDR